MKKYMLFVFVLLFAACKDDDTAIFSSDRQYAPITGASVEEAEKVVLDGERHAIDIYFAQDPAYGLRQVPVKLTFADNAWLNYPLKENPAVLDLSADEGCQIIAQIDGRQVVYTVRAILGNPFKGVYARIGGVTAYVANDRIGKQVYFCFKSPDDPYAEFDFSQVEFISTLNEGYSYIDHESSNFTLDLTRPVKLRFNTPKGDVDEYTIRAHNYHFTLPVPAGTSWRHRAARPPEGVLYMAEGLGNGRSVGYMAIVNRYRLGTLPLRPRDTIFHMTYFKPNEGVLQTDDYIYDHLRLLRYEGGLVPDLSDPIAWYYVKPWIIMPASSEKRLCVWKYRPLMRPENCVGQPAFALDGRGNSHCGEIALPGDEVEVDGIRPWWAMQGRTILLRDGVRLPVADTPADACSVIGSNEEGHLFLFVCGKSDLSNPLSLKSDGLTLKQIQDVMLQWGCVNAMTFDGGRDANLVLEGTRLFHWYGQEELTGSMLFGIVVV